MDDLVKRAREALDGVTAGPWKAFIDDSGGQWAGWPLSIDATNITDKTVVRTGGQWPYEWDAKTSQDEAVANARFIAASRELVPAMADRIEALEAERERWIRMISDVVAPPLNTPEASKLKSDAGIPHMPTALTYDCRLAVEGDGPLAYTWEDKPHRLVFSLCWELETIAAALRTQNSKGN